VLKAQDSRLSEFAEKVNRSVENLDVVEVTVARRNDDE